MVAAIEPLLREQLIDRRQKLETVAHGFHRPPELTQLLQRGGRRARPYGQWDLWPVRSLSRSGRDRALIR